MALRSTPAKSCPLIIPILKKTQDIIFGKTRKRYRTSAELPPKLNLSYTGIKDVSALGGVEKLDLHQCREITDVSALGQVKELVLSYCTGIVNVSALGHVKELYLIGCTGITDVSALSCVKVLILHRCTGITDYSAVPQARH